MHAGTTGLPKGVMLSHYNICNNVLQIDGLDGDVDFPTDGRRLVGVPPRMLAIISCLRTSCLTELFLCSLQLFTRAVRTELFLSTFHSSLPHLWPGEYRTPYPSSRRNHGHSSRLHAPHALRKDLIYPRRAASVAATGKAGGSRSV